MKYRLSDLAEVCSSKRIYAKEYRSSGIPFYRGKEIIAKSEGHKIANLLFISEDRYNTLLTKYGAPEENDILISAVGTIGKVYIVDRRDIPFYFKDGNLIRICNYNYSLIDPYYLYYLLKSSCGQNVIKKIEIGSTQKAITIKELSHIVLDIPSLQKQQEISAMFKKIDAQASVNRRLNDNLLELMDKLFNSFFPNINVGYDQIGSFIKNYDRFRKPLSKKQRSEIPGNYRYIGATSVMDHINQYNFNGIYLLLGEDGTVVDDNGYPILQYIFGKFWPNNHTHVLKGKDISTEWLYLFFRQRKVSNIVTGAVQKKISQKNLHSLTFRSPSKDNYLKFDKIIQPIFKSIRIRMKENSSLFQLKQILLKRYF